MVDNRIKQGEIYWIDLPEPKKSEPGFRRPCVVIQNDSFNRSKIKTTIVSILTTNLRLAKAPGNVALKLNEASLPRKSVVNVSQVLTVNKEDLLPSYRIGKLDESSIEKVISGITLVIDRLKKTTL